MRTWVRLIRLRPYTLKGFRQAASIIGLFFLLSFFISGTGQQVHALEINVHSLSDRLLKGSSNTILASSTESSYEAVSEITTETVPDLQSPQSLTSPQESVIERYTIVVTMQQNRLAVLELFTVRNAGDQPGGPLVFTLPDDADSVTVQSDDGSGQLKLEGGTIIDELPLEPLAERSYQLMYTLPLQLPYTWTRTADYAINNLTILTPAAQLAVRSDVLFAQGETELEGVNVPMSAYQALNLAKGFIWQLEFVDPKTLHTPWWRRTLVWGLAAGLLLIISLLFIVHQLEQQRQQRRRERDRNRRRSEMTGRERIRPAEGQSSKRADTSEKAGDQSTDSRERLLDALTELELEYERGRIQPSAYTRKREQLWDELLALEVQSRSTDAADATGKRVIQERRRDQDDEHD